MAESTLIMNIEVFWDVTLCQLVYICQCFGGMCYCLPQGPTLLYLKMVALDSSLASVNNY